MARNSDYNFGFNEDMGYVDIHGRDVKVLVCEKTGRILVPIDELKEMGFRIYRKNQYNKLLIDDSQFTHEFNLFLLECAQSYMLKNKIAFKENEILESINKCKRRLTEEHSGFAKQTSNSPSSFLSNHVIEKNLDESISITKTAQPALPRFKINPKVSPTLVNSSDLTSSPDRNDEPISKTPTFMNRISRNSLSFEQSSVKSDQSDESVRNNLRKPKQNGNIRNVGQNQIIASPPRNQNRNDSLDEGRKLAGKPQLEKIELNEDEHDVLITHIESPTCIWVQDIQNAQVLLDIDKRVKEEAQKQGTVQKTEYNNVYLAQDDGSWYRCKPIKFKPLTVTFIDYGNAAQVKESDLKHVSEELASIPCQACKLILDTKQDNLEAFSNITVRILQRSERGSYRVEIVSNDSEDVAPKTTVKQKVDAFFTKPQPLCALENGQRVMVLNETDGKLLLRTKECYDKFKQIEQAIENVTVESIEKIEKHQLVLCNHNGKLRRGQMVDIQGNCGEVELLDFGHNINVNVLSLKNITESLSREPLTYLVSPLIKGYDKSHEKANEMVQKLVKDQSKATVIMESGKFDLRLSDGLLSEKLASLQENSNRILLKDLKMYKPPLGSGQYMLYGFRHSDNVTLVSADELGTHLDVIIQSTVDDDEPYTPVVGEVCYGLYQDNWSRCAINRFMNNRFEVQFIDFGNLEFLKAEQLRKANEDIKTVPILGVPCRFIGLPPLRNIEELLKSHVVDGEIYDLNVKKFDAASERLLIEAPELYKELRESN